MRNLHFILIFIFLVGSISTVEAAARVINTEDAQITSPVKEKLLEKQKKRFAKFQKKIAKKMLKKRGDEKESGIWTSLFFILGLVCIAGGIILGISVFANPIGGFFYFLAGLLIAAGIVLIMLTGSL